MTKSAGGIGHNNVPKLHGGVGPFESRGRDGGNNKDSARGGGRDGGRDSGGRDGYRSGPGSRGDLNSQNRRRRKVIVDNHTGVELGELQGGSCVLDVKERRGHGRSGGPGGVGGEGPGGLHSQSAFLESKLDESMEFGQMSLDSTDYYQDEAVREMLRSAQSGRLSLSRSGMRNKSGTSMEQGGSVGIGGSVGMNSNGNVGEVSMQTVAGQDDSVVQQSVQQSVQQNVLEDKPNSAQEGLQGRGLSPKSPKTSPQQQRSPGGKTSPNQRNSPNRSTGPNRSMENRNQMNSTVSIATVDGPSLGPENIFNNESIQSQLKSQHSPSHSPSRDHVKSQQTVELPGTGSIELQGTSIHSLQAGQSPKQSQMYPISEETQRRLSSPPPAVVVTKENKDNQRGRNKAGDWRPLYESPGKKDKKPREKIDRKSLEEVGLGQIQKILDDGINDPEVIGDGIGGMGGSGSGDSKDFFESNSRELIGTSKEMSEVAAMRHQIGVAGHGTDDGLTPPFVSLELSRENTRDKEPENYQPQHQNESQMDLSMHQGGLATSSSSDEALEGAGVGFGGSILENNTNGSIPENTITNSGANGNVSFATGTVGGGGGGIGGSSSAVGSLTMQDISSHVYLAQGENDEARQIGSRFQVTADGLPVHAESASYFEQGLSQQFSQFSQYLEAGASQMSLDGEPLALEGHGHSVSGVVRVSGATGTKVAQGGGAAGGVPLNSPPQRIRAGVSPFKYVAGKPRPVGSAPGIPLGSPNDRDGRNERNKNEPDDFETEQMEKQQLGLVLNATMSVKKITPGPPASSPRVEALQSRQGGERSGDRLGSKSGEQRPGSRAAGTASRIVPALPLDTLPIKDPDLTGDSSSGAEGEGDEGDAGHEQHEREGMGGMEGDVSESGAMNETGGLGGLANLPPGWKKL